MEERSQPEPAPAASNGEALMALAIGVSELSGAMTDIASTSRLVADKATADADLSAAVIAEAMTSVQALTSALDRTTRCSSDITGTTDEISGLFNEIIKVASQTRLLALNASIEAARVSDPRGKAFAVIADEVRNLAEHTTEITKRGERVVSALAKTATETAASLIESQRRIDDGCVKVGEIGLKVAQVVGCTRTLAETSHSTAQQLEERATIAEDLSRRLNMAAVAAMS